MSAEMPRAWHAARVAELAAAVVVAVHDEGPADVLAAIQRALAEPAPADVDPTVALVTVLAAALPADGRLGELLAWTRPLRPLPNRPVENTSSHDCDVHLLVSGRPVADQVRRRARVEAVGVLTDRGMTAAEIGQHIGTDTRSVQRARAEIGGASWRAS